MIVGLLLQFLFYLLLFLCNYFMEREGKCRMQTSSDIFNELHLTTFNCIQVWKLKRLSVILLHVSQQKRTVAMLYELFYHN